MIGHYLLTLCPAAEDAILTSHMGPGEYFDSRGGDRRCLVGCAAGAFEGSVTWKRVQHLSFDLGPRAQYRRRTEPAYDNLCRRFGTQRTNSAIRNRILSNRARRELRVLETVAV